LTHKDYPEGSAVKRMTLDGVEFLRRWVQHVLPRGFGKIRHYRLLSNRQREDKLAVCRLLLFVAGLWLVGLMASPQPRPSLCPVCGGRVVGDRRAIWSDDRRRDDEGGAC
jgi:hypothetical protein